MSIFSILLFFGFFLALLIFRRYILENVIPRIFNIGFLLVGFFVVGVIFSLLYFCVDLIFCNKLFESKFYLVENSERALNYLYFSFISQLTIGFGDIFPIHPIGKSLSMIQGVIGAVFMGGLIASLLEFSKSSLNYLYLSEIKFFHCDANSNHNSEIFNIDLKIYKTKNSLFNDFKVSLIARHNNGDKYTILGNHSTLINERNEISIDISQKKQYPKLVDNSGELAYQTFNIHSPGTLTIGQSMAGSATLFTFVELYLSYQYSYESRLFNKEFKVENKDDISRIMSLA